jgi:serine/threonine protein kinase
MSGSGPTLEVRRKISSSSSTNYRVLQRLGEGGNSQVYLVVAMDGPNRGVLFALKCFVRLDKLERAQRFKQEVAFLRTTQHPSIMRVVDDGFILDTDGTNRLEYPFVVAEYLPTTLRSVMGGSVRMVDKLSYALQIISGLSYLSGASKPVAHRDIKPENIFVRGPACIIGDFGLMKVVDKQAVDPDDASYMIESIGIRFPKFYRTPDLVEYCKGNATLTSKCDVFQAGLVLAELFMGVNPLIETNEPDSEVKLGPLPVVLGRDGARIRNLIEWMLELDISRRPNAAELLDDWEGAFLDAVDAASQLEGRAF